MFELIIFFSLLIVLNLIAGFTLGKILYGNQIYSFPTYEIGFLGVFFYTFTSTIIHFFLPLNYIVNLGISIFLIFFFLIFLKKEKLKIFNNKKILIISFIAVIVMTINYKPNEDYGFYHLPYIYQFRPLRNRHQ